MKARVVLPGAIAGTSSNEVIELDDQDVTKGVRAFEIESRVGEVTRLRLDFMVLDGTTFEGNVDVYVPDATKEALTRIGWLPPVYELGPLRPEVRERLDSLRQEYSALMQGVALEMVDQSS